MSPILLVVEGTEYASVLSSYLQQFHGFAVQEYDGKQHLIDYLQQQRNCWQSPRLIMLRLHLTALAANQCSPAVFRMVESELAAVSGKLVLASGNREASGELTDGYANSLMVKRVHLERQPVTNLLEWLSLPTGQTECASATFTDMTRSRSMMDSAQRSKQQPTQSS